MKVVTGGCCRHHGRSGPINLFSDEWRTPLSYQTACDALLDLALSEIAGLLHVGGPERMTRLEMGQRIAAYFQRPTTSLHPTSRLDGSPAEPRPRDCSLDSSLWRSHLPNAPWPTLEESLRAE